MTLLQRICADMVNRQDQLERLHSFERARCAGFKTLPGMVEGIRHARVIHESELARCAYILQRHPAANDAVNLPGGCMKNLVIDRIKRTGSARVSKRILSIDEIHDVCAIAGVNCWYDAYDGAYVFEAAPAPPLSNRYAQRVCYPGDPRCAAEVAEAKERRDAERDVLLIALGISEGVAP